MDLRVVFMGSPEFALPTLQALAEHYPVVGVVTQPDKPAGRGRTLTPPPIKVLAGQLGLPVIQPRRLRQPEAMEQLEAWNPNLIVVAAFGQILKPEVLDLPQWGCINVHASLLPRWRGAAPIQAAILAGDAETGVSIMQMDAGIDTGPVFSRRAVPIDPHDTAGTLGARLATLGAGLLLETLPACLSGAITPSPQEDGEPTYAPMLKKEDGLLNFHEAASALARRVRAFQPWPGTFFFWQDQPLKVLRARAVAEEIATPGRRVLYQGLPAVGAADGLLVLDEVQPAGKKVMPGKVFLQGARGWLD
ncbi:MAG: methionyl-tRNA formyltransferase [Chloroflexota bacterium]